MIAHTFSWQAGVEQHTAEVEPAGSIRWVMDVSSWDDERGNGAHSDQRQTIEDFLANGPAEDAPLPLLGEMVAHLGGAPVPWLAPLRLQAAVRAGDLAATRALLRAGASPDVLVLRASAMFLALRGGHVEIAAAMLEAGARADARTPEGTTTLHVAAENAEKAEATPILRALLAGGADVEARGEWGQTPLLSGLRARLSAEGVSVLLAAGAAVNAASSHGYTPLIVEAQNQRRPAVAQQLLAHGADVNARDAGGWSSLLWAITGHALPLVRLLIEAGADAAVIGGPHNQYEKPRSALELAQAYAVTPHPCDPASTDPLVAARGRAQAEAAAIVELVRVALARRG